MISELIRMPIYLFVALVLVASTSLEVLAQSTDDFAKKVDTRLSMQFVKTKEDSKLKGKNQELAIYRVLDVQQCDGEIVPMPDDVVELAFPKGEAGKKSASGKDLPWAKVEPDGMIKMSIPKTYMRKRAKSSAKTFWRIDNDGNKFALIKPDTKS